VQRAHKAGFLAAFYTTLILLNFAIAISKSATKLQNSVKEMFKN